MSDTALTTGADASPSADTSTPANTDSSIDVSAAIEALGDISEEQLSAMERGEAIAPEPAPEPKPAAPKPDADDKGDDSPAANGKDPAKVHRLSLGGLPPEARSKMVQFKTLVTGGMSEAEAAAKVYGTGSAAAPATGKTGESADTTKGDDAPPSTTVEPPPAVASLEAKIEAKKQEIEEVRLQYGDTTALLEELQDLKLDLRDAKRESQNFQASADASLQRAMAEHSELWSDPKAGFAEKCDDEFLLASAKSDPILNRPDWPEQIAKRVKEKFFSRYDVQNAGADDDEPTIPPLPNQRVRLTGSLTGGAETPGSVSGTTILQSLDSLPESDLDALLEKIG